jgi:F420-0:gamma-glutamyl ligase
VDIHEGGQASPVWSDVTVDGERYRRFPVRTSWLRPGDDLTAVLRQTCADSHPGDTIAISEKVVVLLTFRTISISSVRVGTLARVLARSVRPREGSRGISVPEKMQYVVDQVGWPRLAAAVAASAATRPLGISGIFYRVAGSIARDVDGGRPPYEERLIPPLPRLEAATICSDLEELLGMGVAIADLNDYGGSIRAASPKAIPARTLARVLADNPLRQRLTGTPFALVRPLPARPQPLA